MKSLINNELMWYIINPWVLFKMLIKMFINFVHFGDFIKTVIIFRQSICTICKMSFYNDINLLSFSIKYFYVISIFL